MNDELDKIEGMINLNLQLMETLKETMVIVKDYSRIHNIPLPESFYYFLAEAQRLILDINTPHSDFRSKNQNKGADGDKGAKPCR